MPATSPQPAPTGFTFPVVLVRTGTSSAGKLLRARAGARVNDDFEIAPSFAMPEGCAEPVLAYAQPPPAFR